MQKQTGFYDTDDTPDAVPQVCWVDDAVDKATIQDHVAMLGEIHALSETPHLIGAIDSQVKFGMGVQVRQRDAEAAGESFGGLRKGNSADDV